MIEALSVCIRELHDVRLVLLAGVVCLLACYTTFEVVSRVRVLDFQRWSRIIWLAAAAAVLGSGTWATHFIAMLSFRPGLPVAYELGPTVLSVVIAILVSGLGLFTAVLMGRPLLGGGIVGASVGMMHYTGMMALRMPASFHWNMDYIAVSIAIGVTVGATALAVGLRLSQRLAGAGLLALAICGLHFVGMTALQIRPDPTVAMPDALISTDLLAIAVSAVTVLIMIIGLASSFIDARLARRAEEESSRLRLYVTELEETRRELEKRTAEVSIALEQAAAGSQAKSQFLAVMGHELRTPLNAIIGFAELQARQLRGPMGDPSYLEYARHIGESGHALLARINEILDYSNLDTPRFYLVRKKVNPSEIVAAAVDAMAGTAENARVSLTAEYASDVPALSLDPARINQVLRNLLSNAAKFTPPGGSITVTTRAVHNGCAIGIRDTGVGIAPENMAKALELFGQVDGELSRKYEGCGLGLPMSKMLVESHGGTLRIDSTVGQGTTVTITLPAPTQRTRRPTPLRQLAGRLPCRPRFMAYRCAPRGWCEWLEVACRCRCAAAGSPAAYSAIRITITMTAMMAMVATTAPWRMRERGISRVCWVSSEVACPRTYFTFGSGLLASDMFSPPRWVRSIAGKRYGRGKFPRAIRRARAYFFSGTTMTRGAGGKAGCSITVGRRVRAV